MTKAEIEQELAEARDLATEYSRRLECAEAGENCKTIAELQSKLDYIAADERACCPEHVGFREYIAKLTRDKERLEKDYHELLYQVENKYEGESRHQTALRYLRERVGMFRNSIPAQEEARMGEE